ncbi:MAG: MFS transporter [Deltaproteobacteria bacterium]|nr:MFS transporter [Deltaproteobacteria bacterium]
MGRRRMLAIVAGVYVIEGFPMGIFSDLLPVYWAQVGVPLETIGALSGLGLAWAAKPLWSPLVQRFGEGRAWISGSMALVAAALFFGGSEQPTAMSLWMGTGLLCAASATQDIAIDAYTIGLVRRGDEGMANAVRITTYRVGVILAGTLPLLLAGPFGWRTAHLAGGAIALVLAFATWLAPRVDGPEGGHPPLRHAFRTWQSRGAMAGVLGFVLLYRVGDMVMAPMLKPFWVERGLSNEEIALVSTTLGTAATVAGAALGGWIVSRIGISRSLLWLGVFALASNLGYAVAARSGMPPEAIYAASLVEAFCGGLAASGFLAFLMRICEREYAAVQYAVLTGAYATAGRLLGMGSGWATEQVGFATFFAMTAALALPAFALLPYAARWVAAIPEEPET